MRSVWQYRLPSRNTSASVGRSETLISGASGAISSARPLSLTTVSDDSRICPAGARIRLQMLPKPSI